MMSKKNRLKGNSLKKREIESCNSTVTDNFVTHWSGHRLLLFTDSSGHLLDWKVHLQIASQTFSQVLLLAHLHKERKKLKAANLCWPSAYCTLTQTVSSLMPTKDPL